MQLFIILTYQLYDIDQKYWQKSKFASSFQCDGKFGVCPDSRIGGRNDAELIKTYEINGITTIIYARPLQTNEGTNDKAIPEYGEVNVIAAIGPLNHRKEANAHNAQDKTSGKCIMLFRHT